MYVFVCSDPHAGGIALSGDRGARLPRDNVGEITQSGTNTHTLPRHAGPPNSYALTVLYIQ